MSTGHDVERRKTQVNDPRVQPRSAGLNTVNAERKACDHGNHEVHMKQNKTQKGENGKPRSQCSKTLARKREKDL